MKGAAFDQHRKWTYVSTNNTVIIVGPRTRGCLPHWGEYGVIFPNCGEEWGIFPILPFAKKGAMAGFKGQAMYTVDARGRTAIPARMRAALQSDARHTFTVIRGFDRCISLYPLDIWAKLEQVIGEKNPFDRQARAFTRRIMMWAEEVKLDAQGRVGLPKALIDYAGIGERVLIIGAYDRIEIWDPQVFQEYLSKEQVDYETLAARVMESR